MGPGFVIHLAFLHTIKVPLPMKEPSTSTYPALLHRSDERGSRWEYLSFGLVFVGLGVLFSSNYLSAYSYSTTTGVGTKEVAITLHYPLLAFLPLAYTEGPALIAVGLLGARKLLATNKYALAGMAWVGLTLVSLSYGTFTNAIFQSEPGTHLFWLNGTSFALTPLYLSAVGIVALFTMTPSLVGVWMSIRLLSKHRRTLLAAFLLGAVLTFASLLSVQYTATVGSYTRGLPLFWLVLPQGFAVVPAGWYPISAGFALDFLFWSGLALMGVLATRYLWMRPSYLQSSISE